MHFRLSLWVAFFVFAAAGAVRAQTPSATTTPSAMPPGQIVTAKVSGSVSMVLNGTTTSLKNGDVISQTATVTTAADSSVILVFSNGATTQLGSETILVIEQFLQDPFAETVKVSQLQAEPTRSRTRLNLTKGELIGNVLKLNHAQGSSFTVQTPVGAAGIRGTTFRIVFRPTGTGQAFAVFSLSTVEGNVNFQQGATAEQVAAVISQIAGQEPGQPQPQGPDQGQGQGQAGGQDQGQGQGQGGQQGQASGQAGAGTPAQSGGQGQAGSTAGTGSAGSTPGGNGVAVTSGQEVVVTVNVTVNQQTGQLTIAEPPKIASTTPINVETQTLIVQQVQQIVATAAEATFTAPASTSGTGGQQQSADQQQDQQQQQQDQQQSTEQQNQQQQQSTDQQQSQQQTSQQQDQQSSSQQTSSDTGGNAQQPAGSGNTGQQSSGSTSTSSTSTSSTSTTSTSTSSTSTSSTSTGSTSTNPTTPTSPTPPTSPSPGPTTPLPALTPGAGK